MAAAQALDLREELTKFDELKGKKIKFGDGVTKAREVIRRHVDFLDEDRPLFDDHNAMKALVKSCEILEEVEKEIGSLE